MIAMDCRMTAIKSSEVMSFYYTFLAIYKVEQFGRHAGENVHMTKQLHTINILILYILNVSHTK